MKKSTVFLISTILIVGFAVLVIYGLRHSRGVPVVEEEKAKLVVRVPFIEKDIDLSKGLSFDIWDSIARRDIELMYQVMVLPWGKSIVSPIIVKAFHNGESIYFYFQWKDATQNRERGLKKFSDGCALMFPMDDKAQPSTLMMGFLGKANIWHWQALRDSHFWLKYEPTTEAYVDFHYPFEDDELFVVSKDDPASAVNDLMAIRVATITPKEKQVVEGRGIWKSGTWHVVFKRSFKSADNELDAVFVRDKKRLCAFAVWEGEQGDRGGRKSISDWVELQIQ